jgi:hypothetical protein
VSLLSYYWLNWSVPALTAQPLKLLNFQLHTCRGTNSKFQGPEVRGISDSQEISSNPFSQQMHSLLKHKMLQLTLKISLYIAPTCFGPFGPSSGSIRRNLAKVRVFVELLVKIHS